MAGQLFALKRDVDELSQDMKELKRSYNTVDFIAHTVKNLWDEQQCQAAQMRRIEGRLDVLEAEVKKINGRLDSLEVRMDRLEAKMDRLEELVIKIVKHLGIQ
ncbi:MAG: hypothetical protein AAB606_00670 [Patescibacteria group bacterium]